jgi:hypothetical protein
MQKYKRAAIVAGTEPQALSAAYDNTNCVRESTKCEVPVSGNHTSPKKIFIRPKKLHNI